MKFIAKCVPKKAPRFFAKKKHLPQARAQATNALNSFMLLPRELQARIVHCLPTDDQLAVRLVCREFSSLPLPFRTATPAQQAFVEDRLEVTRGNANCPQIWVFTGAAPPWGPIIVGERRHHQYETFSRNPTDIHRKTLPDKLPHFRRMALTLTTLPSLCGYIDQPAPKVFPTRQLDEAAARIRRGEAEVKLERGNALISFFSLQQDPSTAILIERQWVANTLGGSSFKEIGHTAQVDLKDALDAPRTSLDYRALISYMLCSPRYQPVRRMKSVAPQQRSRAQAIGLFNALSWRVTIRCAELIFSKEYAQKLASDLVAAFCSYAHASTNPTARDDRIANRVFRWMVDDFKFETEQAVQDGMARVNFHPSYWGWRDESSEQKQIYLRTFAPDHLDTPDLWHCFAQGFGFGLQDLVDPVLAARDLGLVPHVAGGREPRESNIFGSTANDRRAFF